jgi:high-affinity nickel-transport protein
MLAALSFMALGFFLGMRHATDADHVIAVGTIVTRQRTVIGGILVGAVWGIGHTLTIVAVGVAVIVFRVTIPTRVGLTFEMAAALMLIALGLWSLSSLRPSALRHTAAVHSHPHSHGDYVHSHRHGHGPGDHGHPEDRTPQAWLDRHLGRLGIYQLLRPLIVGVMHGLAGSAAIALLVLTAIDDARWALGYLALFGLGTIVGMIIVTAAVAVPVAYTSERSPRIERRLRLAAGVLSVAMGAFIVYRVGVADGLFAWSVFPAMD